MADFLPFTDSAGTVGTAFSDFTTKLVTEVLEAVVDSSIRQLEAYGDMVKKVSGEVADYQKEVAGIDASKTASDPANNASINAFAQQVLGLPDFDVGGAGDVELDKNKQSQIASQLAGAEVSSDASTKSIEDEMSGAAEVTMTQAHLGEYILDHLKSKSSAEYELLKFIIIAGLQKVVITEGHILTKVNMTFDMTESHEGNSSSLDTQAKGWSWNASLRGNIGGKKKFLGGAASGGMYNQNVKITAVNASDLSSTRLSASMFGEVKIGFATESFPPPGIGG